MMIKKDKDKEKEREKERESLSKEKERETPSKEKDNESLPKELDDQFEMQAGEYVHKFNELCRQHKMAKPNYRWKYEKVGKKKKVKYYINQDELGVCVKITDRSKAFAKLQSVKLAYEEAIRALLSKQPTPQPEQHPDSDSMTAKYHEQLKDIDTLAKADKKELLPALRRLEQDIDVFLESESKIFSPAKSKTGSVESNPIEYAMIKKGRTYFDTSTPVARAPSVLPSFPLPKRPTDKLIYPVMERLPADKQTATDDSRPKDETEELDASSTLRISSGFAYQPTHMQNRKDVLENFGLRAVPDSLQQLNQVQTIRTRPKQGLQIQADLDIEMLLYLESQRKLLAEAAERARYRTTSSNTNFLRILNLLLLQNDKISIEIKISSDFGMLSKSDRKQAKGSDKGPEKMMGKAEKSYKVMGIKSSESSVDSQKKPEPKKSKVGEQASPQDTRKGREGTSNSPPQQTGSLKTGSLQTAKTDSREAPTSLAGSKETTRESDSANNQIVWLSRLNCFYMDCCFTTVLGAGRTTGKSINDAAVKMLIYLDSLVNF